MSVKKKLIRLALMAGLAPVLILMVGINKAYGQQDRKTYDALTAAIQSSFNANQPDKIYAHTSEVFQKKMSGEQFALGMSKFHAKVGDWISTIFKEENEKGSDYL